MEKEAYCFEEIYGHYNTMVYNLAISYVQSVEDAEEITQDVFIQVHKSISDFNHKASYKTWIYRITINKSLDHLKAKSRKKRLAFVSHLFHPNGNHVHEAIEFNHPGIIAEQKENAAILFACIDELAPNQKTALLLSKVEGLKNEDISEIMKTSVSAVESYLFRAKQNLQSIIDKKYPNLHKNSKKATSKSA